MIDVHQHLWPEAFVDRLRARRQPPYLTGWTLHTATEAPYDVDPAAHELGKRVALEQDLGTTLAAVSLSSPLGVEHLGDEELLTAWHAGAAEFPKPFRAWASVNLLEPDVEELKSLLAKGFLGLQLPAHVLGTPAGWDAVGELLRTAELSGRPILVHPGVADQTDGPGWWAPVVDYTAQLQAAWWAWHAYGGRRAYPELRMCFVAAAGLAPVHHERLTARGGRLGTIDPKLYVDTSSYGPQGIDAVARVLGIDQVVHGTDRPYAGITDLRQGDAATAVIRHDNPHRLLFGAGFPPPERGVQ
ncbi:amidohydrolase family protein [Kribbella solani]|uniref:Putative TIM-barrel fold metal-dependent hydrolase n=1 Tax=Kribbella solani TaxID=236067 RepID=A0A841DVV5_9ACTN|nr:amidohydrolase family protein [Kribbella solani]MBB5982249.1 putative TIM-barrel fold metal-dependent hydrolase [Kribbella solani]MDX2968517.1 amidohydrolase family protein [Kribbella solani]